MKRLRDIFASAAFKDHAKGLAMGASAGFLFGPKGAAVGGAIGLMMGAELMVDMFESAVKGHQMATGLVPVLATATRTRMPR